MPLPAPQSSVRVVTLKIDGQDLSAREDETIMELAREHQIPIPSLCYLEGLSIWGACRLCVVEIAGSSRLFSACATRVAEGMQVFTSTERLQRYRRTIVELPVCRAQSHLLGVCVERPL